MKFFTCQKGHQPQHCLQPINFDEKLVFFPKKLFFTFMSLILVPTMVTTPASSWPGTRGYLLTFSKLVFVHFHVFMAFDRFWLPWKWPTSFQQNEHQCGRFHRISPCNLLVLPDLFTQDLKLAKLFLNQNATWMFHSNIAKGKKDPKVECSWQSIHLDEIQTN